MVEEELPLLARTLGRSPAPRGAGAPSSRLGIGARASTPALRHRDRVAGQHEERRNGIRLYLHYVEEAFLLQRLQQFRLREARVDPQLHLIGPFQSPPQDGKHDGQYLPGTQRHARSAPLSLEAATRQLRIDAQTALGKLCKLRHWSIATQGGAP